MVYQLSCFSSPFPLTSTFSLSRNSCIQNLIWLIRGSTASATCLITSFLWSSLIVVYQLFLSVLYVAVALSDVQQLHICGPHLLLSLVNTTFHCFIGSRNASSRSAGFTNIYFTGVSTVLPSLALPTLLRARNFLAPPKNCERVKGSATPD